MTQSGTTVLITDMEGSTALGAARGDEEAMELRRVHEKLIRDSLVPHAGREIKSMGDGFMIAFTSPDAGIACALDIQDALRRHNAGEPKEPILVRIGLNTGPVIEEGGDLYGTTVNATSRIVSKARGGQILVSEGVRAASETIGDWRFVDRGQFWLKGLTERWTLYEVTRGAELGPLRELAGLTPFLDREDERATLRLLLDAAIDGRGALVALSGEAGAGKTRIAEEIGAEASGRGMRFLVSRCYEANQTHPFALFVQVLEAVERSVSPESFRAQLGEAAGEIARLVPHIRRHYPDVPQPVVVPDPDRARHYLQSSIRDVLASIARDRPLFILFDDIHWADDPSLRLLEQLATDLPNLPILIIGTYITTQLAASRVLGATLEALHRHRLVERIHIGPLASEDLGGLLEALGGPDPPSELVQVLFRATEGNAFFAEEVARHLLEHGRLFDEHGRWRADTEPLDLDVPETVRLAIGRRLDGLGHASRKELATAAVVGRAFGFDLLSALSELSEDDLIDALEQAERDRIIVSTSDGGSVEFRFSHELIRQTLVAEVSLTRQQLLHHRIASAMERMYGSSLADHAAEIAYHLLEAGRRADPSTTSRLLVMAGERALETASYEEAHRHLDRALALVSSSDMAARAPILEKLGDAERSMGHLDDALATWDEALDAYEATDDPDEIARLCLDAGLQVAFWRPSGHVLRLIDRGLKAIGDRPSVHRGGLLALSAALTGVAGHYERAERTFDEALDLVRAHGEHRVLGMALYMRAYHYFLYQEYARTVEVGREGMEHLRQASEVWTLASMCGHVGSALAWMGRFDEAAAIAQEAKTLGRKLGNWTAYYSADRARSFRHLGSNPDSSRLEEDGRRDYELGKRLGVEWLTATGRGRMGLAAFWSGRWSEALECYEETARLEPPGAGGGHPARLFLCHAYMGNKARALDLIDRARSGFARPNRANTATSWLSALMAIEALALLGERDAAAELYAVAAETIAKGTVLRGWDFRLVQTLAGIAASCGGEWERSEDHFRAALHQADELPMRLEEPEARRFYAQMLFDRADPGDVEEARRQLDVAIERYREIGMPKHEALAQQLLEHNP